MPLEDAIIARSRTSWHRHADETSWHVFAPRDGDGPAKWWLWVFLGPDTACFVMDPSRAGAVLARHAGIDESGQLTADEDGRAQQRQAPAGGRTSNGSCPGTPARLARKPGASRHGPADTGTAGITPAPAL